MHTFRSPSGVDFTGTTWPSISIPSTPQPNDDIETTTWVYDPATGLLKQKIDDSGQAVTYTYIPDGKLSTRQWARHDANTVTTYTYDSNTGEMTGIDYPGSDTPDVTFTYTRLGRQATVQDGVGTRTFTYDEGVTGKLHLLSEAIAGTGGFYSKTITRDYQGTGTGEIPGRDAGFHIGTEYGVAYHYDNAGTGGQLTGTGRFRRITGPGLPGYVSPS
ncbi:MAG TPA: hypothetical protein PLL20_17765, partial [Phycisphaerae bacterium]|nr:hypothetical protein [Phycisphaerae bacterium]